MRLIRSFSVILWALSASAGLAQDAAAPTGLEAEALWEWTYVGDPQISPKGDRVAFVVARTDKAKDRYATDLWILDLATGASKPLTTHEANETQPTWSPDGSRLAFVSGRAEGSQIFLLDMSGGEARQLTQVKPGAGAIAWSPDGQRIAFLSSALTEAERKAKEEKEKAEKEAAEAPRLADGGKVLDTAEPEQVIENLFFRRDGSPGYLSLDRTHIWTVPVGDDFPAEATRITHGDYNDGPPVWSADGKTIFFGATRKPDAEYTLSDSEVYRVPADGSAEPQALTSRYGPDGSPMVSPDGRWVAYFGFDESERGHSYHVQNLYIMRPDGSEKRCLTEGYDRSLGDGTGQDMASPFGSGSQAEWAADSASIFATSANRGQTQIVQISLADGKVRPITRMAQGNISAFTVSPQGTVAALHSDPMTPFGLSTFALDKPETVAWTRHTRFNEEPMQAVQRRPYDELWFESFDGLKIQGWLIKPPDFDPDKKYPMILYIHGGPHTMYGTTFFFEFQMLADAGYVVLITNPRGSTGYGTEFGNIIQYNYPGDDYRDLMAAVDLVLSRGFVDEKRLGVAGGSGGGLLTTWIVGQTERFAAAVAQRNVTNWRSFVGTSDFNYFFTQRWFRGFPWEELDDYVRRSPLSYVGKATTPVLLIHSQEDYRTPLEQSLQYYLSLKMQKKPAKLVVFPDESHGLSRSGRPSHRIARLNHIQTWFDQWLKGDAN